MAEPERAQQASRVATTQHVDTRRIKSYTRLVASDLFFISMAARMLDMHPQTLRKYERLGLVRPTRTIGSVRVYSRDEVERLRLIKHLVDEVGVNLAGVQRLLSVAEVVERLRPLTHGPSLARAEGRRRLAQELDRLYALLGL
jgi:MerR family transcriptional regulator/heat shock protein HspR